MAPRVHRLLRWLEEEADKQFLLCLLFPEFWGPPSSRASEFNRLFSPAASAVSRISAISERAQGNLIVPHGLLGAHCFVLETAGLFSSQRPGRVHLLPASPATPGTETCIFAGSSPETQA